MISFDDSALRRPRARFEAAADDMAAAVTAGSLLAAAHVAARSSGTDAVQVMRVQLVREGVTRRVLDSAGRAVAAGVLATLPGSFTPDAFDMAVYTVSKLLLTAWDARRAGGAL